MPRFVVTGAPGTGKTAVISLLSERYVTVREPARQLIAQHAAATGEATLDDRPELFLSRLVKSSIGDYSSVGDDVLAFFDRGLPDCVAYAVVLGLDPGDAITSAKRYRYDSPVFIAPPWQEIYTQDADRRATFEQVEAFDAHLRRAYRTLGYQLVELHRGTPEERVAMMSDVLDLEPDLAHRGTEWELAK